MSCEELPLYQCQVNLIEKMFKCLTHEQRAMYHVYRQFK